MTPDEPIRTLLHGPAVLVHLDDHLRQVAEFFVEQSIGAAAVRNTDPLAIISERDILRSIADGSAAGTTRVRDVMTEDTWTCSADDKIGDVAAEMLRDEIRHAPVLDEAGHVIGMVSMRDVLRAYVGQ